MSTALVAIEGVLGTGHDFMTMLPSTDAMRLYGALLTSYQVTLVTAVARPDMATAWLGQNGYRDYGSVLTRPVSLMSVQDDVTDEVVRRVQIRSMRASRVAVGLFVDSNPFAVRIAIQQGIPSLLWTPGASASQREDLQRKPIRSWADMA